MKQEVASEKAPKAIGPYSQAIETDSLIFVSGQLPIDAETGVFVPGGIKEQTKQAIENIQYILEEANSSLQNVIKTTVLLSDMVHFSEMNEVYASYFQAPYPARAAYEVAKLPNGALVEIEAIAHK